MTAEEGQNGMRQLVFVTGNAGKLREVQACLAGHFTVESVKKDLPELQCNSVFEVSRHKALVAYDLLKHPVLVEDTALCFEALGGMPGPYVKWFLDSIGPLGLIKLLDGFNSRRAYAICVFSYCTGPGAVTQFQGRCDGQVVNAPRGDGGFGWDCIFEPDECCGMTYAEMPDEKKNEMIHAFPFPREVNVFIEPPGTGIRLHLGKFDIHGTVSEALSRMYNLLKLLKRNNKKGKNERHEDDRWIVAPSQCDAAVREEEEAWGGVRKKHGLGRCSILRPEDVMNLTMKEVLQLYPETFGVLQGGGVYFVTEYRAAFASPVIPPQSSTRSGGGQKNQGDAAMHLELLTETVVERESFEQDDVDHTDVPVLFGFMEEEEEEAEDAVRLLEAYVIAG